MLGWRAMENAMVSASKGFWENEKLCDNPHLKVYSNIFVECFIFYVI